jgi:multiple sugar transport system substrate-binding protein
MTPRHRSHSWLAVAAAASAVLALAGCGAATGKAEAGNGTGSITIWAHQGQDSENQAVQKAVADFNKSQSNVKASLRLIAADTYTNTVTNTPPDKLPDAVEMDGPTVASMVYNGKIAPIDGFVSKKTVENATSGSVTEGTYGGKLYALAMYDSALGLFGNKKLLDKAGVHYPTSPQDAWTAKEFDSAVKTLAKQNPSGKSLDISEANLANEWGTYAFSPLIWSAGGNLIKSGKAAGVLDTGASVTAVDALKGWKPYVDANSDNNAFTSGRVALSWGGHWLYPDYSKAVGKDLVALPLPNMGEGTKTGAGSWTWGIGSGTKNGKAAGAFVDFLLNNKNVKAMTDANGAPPATKSAFAADPLYQSGGALSLFGEQLQKTCAASDITADCIAVYLPVTPGYPTVTSAFSSALSAIYGGADAKKQLTQAANKIDQAYSDNGSFKQ